MTRGTSAADYVHMHLRGFAALYIACAVIVSVGSSASMSTFSVTTTELYGLVDQVE